LQFFSSFLLDKFLAILSEYHKFWLNICLIKSKIWGFFGISRSFCDDCQRVLRFWGAVEFGNFGEFG